jgi:hypothetical protein
MPVWKELSAVYESIRPIDLGPSSRETPIQNYSRLIVAER